MLNYRAVKNVVQILSMFIGVLFAYPASAGSANVGFLQVEGMMLGFYPNLGDGIRVVQQGDSALKFEPGKHCFNIRNVDRPGRDFDGTSYVPEEREDVRNKLTGLIGYPGVSTKELKEEWLRSAAGLASGYYRDNLAAAPGERSIQLIFVPKILAPRPLKITATEWTPEAKRVLEAEGWDGLIRYCGTHFVEAVGDESYVIYSVRIDFADVDQRKRVESVRLEKNNQSPGLLLNNLHRMNQRFELGGGGNRVTVDILSVGGHSDDLLALQSALSRQMAVMQTEAAKESVITRTTVSCAPDALGPCAQVVQLFNDYQFGRLNISGREPAFAPVRFRIAPLVFLEAMNRYNKFDGNITTVQAKGN